MGPLTRLHDGITIAGLWIATALVGYLTLVTAGEVFSRYVLSAPTDWAPDTAAVSFGLVTFLAVPWLSWKAGHASMDFLLNAAPPALGLWMARVNYVIGALVCGACAWVAGIEAARQIAQGVMIVSVTPIPKWVVFVPMVYALGSSALYFLRHLTVSFAPRPDAT